MPRPVPAIRTLLRQLLPNDIYDVVRMVWWYLSFYLPRLVISRFVTRKPTVHAVSGKGSLEKELRNVNVIAPTQMCRIMTECGSDKGKGSHNFTTVYSALFNDRRDKRLQIFELGLGTNNPKLASNMGLYGVPGASLRGWRQFFPYALVYGADVDLNILFREDRIITFHCDQLDRSSVHKLWSEPELQVPMDIVIEDGLHTFEANISFLEGSLVGCALVDFTLSRISPSIRLIVWCDRIETIYSKQYPHYEFVL